MNERYSMEVSDESVLIYGELTIEETFDFLCYFEKRGYDSIGIGHQNSSLCMYKTAKQKNQQQIEKEQPIVVDHPDEIMKKKYIELCNEKEQIEILYKRTEQLIKDRIDLNNENDDLNHKNDELKREIDTLNLANEKLQKKSFDLELVYLKDLYAFKNEIVRLSKLYRLQTNPKISEILLKYGAK